MVVYLQCPASVRLVNGSMGNEGRLEFYNNGSWLALCLNSDYDDSLAKVVCRQLGYNASGSHLVPALHMYGRGNVDVYNSSSYRCTGNETALYYCPQYSLYYNYCPVSSGVAVTCNSGVTETPSARLLGGNNSYEGRVQVFYDGVWSTVCNANGTWTSKSSDVFCRSAFGEGYRGSVMSADDRLSLGSLTTGAILLSDVVCSGEETSLLQCRHAASVSLSCNHTNDVAVRCFDGAARLVGSENGTEGRLEHYVAGSWFPVCADGFNLNAASVVCRELGLSPINATYSSNSSSNSSSIPADMHFQCAGSESHLSLCQVTNGACSTTQVIYVKCYVPGCGVVRDQSSSLPIIGGTREQESQFPWMAMLIIGDTLTCGGSIIDPLHIVVAARCIYYRGTFTFQVHKPGNVTESFTQTNVRGMEIIAGKQESSITQGHSWEQRVRVQAAIYHALFTDSALSPNDIAVLRLERPLTFNHRVSALCLPEATSQLPNQCVAAGWGRIESMNRPSQLMTVTMAAYNRQGCLGLADYMSWIHQSWGQDLSGNLHENTMCLANATYGGQTMCYGDSGSPVFCLDPSGLHYQLMGIVSWGQVDCPTSVAMPTVCTFVPPYLGWIANATSLLESPCARKPCTLWSVCLEVQDTYRCVCTTGYTGTNCSIEINACESSPCQNGGTCTNYFGQFSCYCPLGFDGLQCEKACGGNLTGQSGVFSTAGYPQYYASNTDCYWNLHVPQGHAVQLTFWDFLTESCSYDYVEIREINAMGRMVRDNLCGAPSTPVTVESSVSLWIHFHSDSVINYRGFNATYQLYNGLCNGAPCQQTCSMSSDLSSYQCGCNIGYVLNDDNVTCRAANTTDVIGQGEVRHDVTCGQTEMSFSIPLPASFDLPPIARLSDPRCQVDVSGHQLQGRTSLNACGTKIAFTRDVVIFSNSIFLLHTNHSGNDRVIPIRCTYNRSADLQLSYLPLVRQVLFTEEGVGRFQFQIQQFQDATYSSVVDEASYPLRTNPNQEIFVALSLNDPDPGSSEVPAYGIEVESCIASPIASVTLARLGQYEDLIVDGCPASPNVRLYNQMSTASAVGLSHEDNTTTTPRASGNIFRFSFQSVTFYGATDPSAVFAGLVYIHCHVELCSRTLCHEGATCPVHRRQRRSLDWQSRSAGHSLSTGPLLIVAAFEEPTIPVSPAVIALSVVAAVASLAVLAVVVAWRRSSRQGQGYRMVKTEEH